MALMACGDLTLAAAERSGALRITGDREAALELLDRLSLVDLLHPGR